MKIVHLLVSFMFMLVLVSCNEPEPDPNACINTAQHMQPYLTASEITTHYSVLSGGVREYRYSEQVTGVCTDFYVTIFAVIEVVDSVDAQVQQQVVATTTNGALSLNFDMPQSGTAQDPGYTRYMGDSGSGFLLSSAYPSPAAGEVTVGINISFPSQGSELLDSLYFFGNVKNMVLSIGYYQ